MDTNTLYVESGVANESQVSDILKGAILACEKILGWKNKASFKVNIIIDKEGRYFGYGYVRVSHSQIYWMLLGKNPDGSDRYEEFPDPNWVAPVIDYSIDPLERNKGKSWVQILEEEEAMIRPTIRKPLPPLVTLSGYTYNEAQKKHLMELELSKAAEAKNQESINDGNVNEKKETGKDEKNVNEKNVNEKKEIVIPNTGYIILSRAYVKDPDDDEDKKFIKNRICARVPDWVPEVAFKSIFTNYANEESRSKKGTVYLDKDNEITDTYPIVHFVKTKKAGKMVFVTFDPASKDALFALLMNKKLRIQEPGKPNNKALLVFTSAYDTTFRK